MCVCMNNSAPHIIEINSNLVICINCISGPEVFARLASR